LELHDRLVRLDLGALFDEDAVDAASHQRTDLHVANLDRSGQDERLLPAVTRGLARQRRDPQSPRHGEVRPATDPAHGFPLFFLDGRGGAVPRNQTSRTVARNRSIETSSSNAPAISLRKT